MTDSRGHCSLAGRKDHHDTISDSEEGSRSDTLCFPQARPAQSAPQNLHGHHENPTRHRDFIEAGHGSAMPDVTARKGRTQVPAQGRASVATRPLTLVREARGTEVAPVEPDGEGVLGEQAESAQSRRLPGPPCSVRAESLGGCWSKKRPSSSAPNRKR